MAHASPSGSTPQMEGMRSAYGVANRLPIVCRLSAGSAQLTVVCCPRVDNTDACNSSRS